MVHVWWIENHSEESFLDYEEFVVLCWICGSPNNFAVIDVRKQETIIQS